MKMWPHISQEKKFEDKLKRGKEKGGTRSCCVSGCVERCLSGDGGQGEWRAGDLVLQPEPLLRLSELPLCEHRLHSVNACSDWLIDETNPS